MVLRSSTTTGALPETTAYWSPRMGFNWDVLSDGTTQVRGGTGLFTGKPPYVWISNQIGNTGVLYRIPRQQEHHRVSVQPESGQIQASGDRRRRRAATSSMSPIRASASRRRGGPTSASTGSCRWGSIGTVDFIYNRDVNAPVYINANLPAAESAYTGVDNRPRWVATTAFPPACSGGRRTRSTVPA